MNWSLSIWNELYRRHIGVNRKLKGLYAFAGIARQRPWILLDAGLLRARMAGLGGQRSRYCHDSRSSRWNLGSLAICASVLALKRRLAKYYGSQYRGCCISPSYWFLHPPQAQMQTITVDSICLLAYPCSSWHRRRVPKWVWSAPSADWARRSWPRG